MSLEKAELFIRRLKYDDQFRKVIACTNDHRTLKAILVCEKLVFSEHDLIEAVISELMKKDRIATYLTRGWKFVAE